MKTRTIQLTAVLIITLLLIPAVIMAQGNVKKRKAPKAPKGTVMLFNGKNLNNWVFHLKDPAVDPSTVFTVKDGVIHIKGDPFGYMRTKKSFSDYKLHVEYRYPVE